MGFANFAPTKEVPKFIGLWTNQREIAGNFQSIVQSPIDRMKVCEGQGITSLTGSVILWPARIGFNSAFNPFGRNPAGQPRGRAAVDRGPGDKPLQQATR